MPCQITVDTRCEVPEVRYLPLNTWLMRDVIVLYSIE